MISAHVFSPELEIYVGSGHDHPGEQQNDCNSSDGGLLDWCGRPGWRKPLILVLMLVRMPVSTGCIATHGHEAVLLRTGRADFPHPALRLASPRGTRNKSLAASVIARRDFLLRLTTQLAKPKITPSDIIAQNGSSVGFMARMSRPIMSRLMVGAIAAIIALMLISSGNE
jgi:hypothetical protein